MADRMWFKGLAALELDAWYRRGDVETNLRDALLLLREDESFETIVSQLNRAGRWNPDFGYPISDALQGPEFESVMRQGYLEAIGLALLHRPPVPIKTFWMTGVENDRFEMHVCDEAEHVSVTLLVPEVEGGSRRPESPESWRITIDGEGAIEVTQTSGPPDLEPPSSRDTAAE